MALDKQQKSQQFRRLAQTRTDIVLDKIRILGNCANRSTYEYTDDEVNKIFAAIDEQLRTIKAKFKRPRRKFNF